MIYPIISFVALCQAQKVAVKTPELAPVPTSCTVGAECGQMEVCEPEKKICISEPGPDRIGTALSMTVNEDGSKTETIGWADNSQIVEITSDTTTLRTTYGIPDATTGKRPILNQSSSKAAGQPYPTPDDSEPENYPQPVDDENEKYPQPNVDEMEEPMDDDTMAKKKMAEMEAKRPASEYALDRINQADWEGLDNKVAEEDEYERFFIVENATRCANENGVLPKKSFVKQEDQITEKGNCHHICASQMDGMELCFGYSQNKVGDCEFYHEPLSTFQGAANTDDFEGEGCWIKGISCGGHTAINCEHCPTKSSEHPETECNGQCIYDYEHIVDPVDGSQKVLGACRGIDEEMDKDLVDCGAHMAHTCKQCVERYSYHCEEKYRYCNGDCNFEAGDCGSCPVTTTTTTEAPTTATPEAPTTTTTEAPTTTTEELGADATGGDMASEGFNSAAADLLG